MKKTEPLDGCEQFVILILSFGHIFNFLMSIIGAFVHPARLMFLEFFGRFYEGGGGLFKPFTSHYENIEIID